MNIKRKLKKKYNLAGFPVTGFFILTILIIGTAYLFYVYSSPGCETNSDCEACFTTCDEGECVENIMASPSPCGRAVWEDDYPDCGWDTSDCGDDCETFQDCGDEQTCVDNECIDIVVDECYKDSHCTSTANICCKEDRVDAIGNWCATEEEC